MPRARACSPRFARRATASKRASSPTRTGKTTGSSIISPCPSGKSSSSSPRGRSSPPTGAWRCGSIRASSSAPAATPRRACVSRRSKRLPGAASACWISAAAAAFSPSARLYSAAARPSAATSIPKRRTWRWTMPRSTASAPTGSVCMPGTSSRTRGCAPRSARGLILCLRTSLQTLYCRSRRSQGSFSRPAVRSSPPGSSRDGRRRSSTRSKKRAIPSKSIFVKKNGIVLCVACANNGHTTRTKTYGR